MTGPNVVIHTEPLPDAFRWNPQNPVTGTSKTYVRLAEELSKMGGRVSVVYDGPVLYHPTGVMFIPRGEGAEALDRERVVIDCNIARPRKGSRARFQWTSFYESALCNGDGYDRLFLLSKFHWSVLEPVIRAPVSVLPLGCDFDVLNDPNLSARGRFCCFTSAPDRGLVFLQSIWPEVFLATGYELMSTAYNQTQAPDAVKAVLDASRFWLHPCTGVELYCVSGIEAQARGCVPVFVPHMALPETVRYGVLAPDIHRFKETLIETLATADADALERLSGKRAHALAANPIPTWADTARLLLQEVSL